LLSRGGKASMAALGVAGLGVAGVAALGLASGTKSPSGPPVAVGGPGTTISASVAPTVPSDTGPSDTAAAVHPVSVSIPAIKVDTTLQALDLSSTGALNPPTNLTQAGWYTGSSVPGQPGPSVIAGHVDSYKGPAVFFDLRYLAPGDAITVKLSDGTSVVFMVTDVDQYPKDDFPTASVYGPRPDPELRLITCGGSFTAGHYLDNVVVYATLAATST
jgi:sortase (surface protein transpeptidase)